MSAQTAFSYIRVYAGDTNTLAVNGYPYLGKGSLFCKGDSLINWFTKAYRPDWVNEGSWQVPFYTDWYWGYVSDSVYNYYYNQMPYLLSAPNNFVIDKSIYISQLDSIIENDTLPSLVFNDTGKFLLQILMHVDFGFVSGNSKNVVSLAFQVEDCPPKAGFLVNNKTLCQKECVVFTENSEKFPSSFKWYFEGGNPSYFEGKKPPPVCYDNPGTYDVSLVVKNSAGEDSLYQANYITVNEGPQFFANQQQIINAEFGEELSLQACGIGSEYEWISTFDLSCINCTEIDLMAIEKKQDYVCIVSETNCLDTCSYSVLINNPETNIFIPNVFTPNNDGVNDVLEIFGTNIDLIEFKIFNRWGEKIYESSDINSVWDGTYLGKQQPVGVYAYYVLYKSKNNKQEKIKKGSISLLR